MAEAHNKKPLLTIEQQINHLKLKGIKFELCPEDEAVAYLRDKCNFFKLASYRKLFSKHEGGPRDGRYVNLDFGQLRLLASLDQELRHALLGMTLDIEHFQKVALLRKAEERGEDGYTIVADYMASLSVANREYRLRELKTSVAAPTARVSTQSMPRTCRSGRFWNSPRSAPSSTSCASAQIAGATGTLRPPTTTSSA